MLCDICGKNPATVHLTEIVDDQMTELHLCESCAREKSTAMEQQFGLSDLLAGMADTSKSPSSVDEQDTPMVNCPNCNLSYADFKKIGRLGCGECYSVFKKYLAPLLKRIHGSIQHTGKSPTRSTIKGSKRKPDLQDLRMRMQKAIETEAFEDAARLRDQIKEMEKKQEEKKQN